MLILSHKCKVPWLYCVTQRDQARPRQNISNNRNKVTNDSEGSKIFPRVTILLQTVYPKLFQDKLSFDIATKEKSEIRLGRRAKESLRTTQNIAGLSPSTTTPRFYKAIYSTD